MSGVADDDTLGNGLDEMTEEEKDDLLERMAEEIDDEGISRICELALQASPASESNS